MLHHSFHNHTERCNHAVGTVADYVDAARGAGLRSFGMSDHIPFPGDRWWPHVRMSYDQLDSYIAEVLRQREESKDIEVFLGAECEWLPEFHDYYPYLLDEAGFHYLIGGPHWSPMDDGTWLGYTKLKRPRQLRRFARYVMDMIGSGMFTYIAHPDVCFAGYGKWDEDARACSLDIIRCAVEHDMPLELNANGMRKRDTGTIPGSYPFREFWELASREGVRALIGSDAHTPSDIIDHCDECAVWMEELQLHDVQHELYRVIRRRADLTPAVQFLHTESL